MAELAGVRKGNGGVRQSRRMGEIGVSGLERHGGRVYAEWLNQLKGRRGHRVRQEMADNDSTIGSALFAIEMLMRGAPRLVEPFSESDPEHVERSLRFNEMLDDMESTFEAVLTEILTMIPHRFSLLEIVYKRRVGPDEKDPTRRSRHADSLIGIRDLAPRSPETIEEWEFDEHDRVVGAWQYPRFNVGSRASSGGRIFIPAEKYLLFHPSVRKGNPEGRWVLRNAYLSWWRKSRIEEAEAIGVERDLVGIPVWELPPELFEAASAEELAAYRKIGEDLRNDEQACVLYPRNYDEKGNPDVVLRLLSTQGTRLFDTSAIIERYDRKILQTLLADFIALGHENVGSFSLSSDKTAMFSSAIGAWLRSIAAVLNRHLIPRIFRLNGWGTSELPTFSFGDVEEEDVERWANAVGVLTNTGYIVPGGATDEDAIRQRLGMPQRDDDSESMPGEASVPGAESILVPGPGDIGP